MFSKFVNGWQIFYPAKTFLVDGEIVSGASGYHSEVLQYFINLGQEHFRRPTRNSKKIKRLKPYKK